MHQRNSSDNEKEAISQRKKKTSRCSLIYEGLKSVTDLQVSPSDNEEATSHRLIPTTKILSKSLSEIICALEQFSQNDPKFDRSIKVKRSVIVALKCYKKGLLRFLRTF